MSKKSVQETQNAHFVTKSNMLIEANYKLGVIEQKIILCLASNISPDDSDFKTYTLPVKEFSNLLGYKGPPRYTDLRQITKELMQKAFEVRIEKKVIQVSWLSYVAYNETEGTIDIRFDPFLRPYLLHLKQEFTSYRLENVVKLKSSYAIRIYELLKQYEKLQERTFLVKDLRKMLGAADIYPAYANFKQRVLVQAQNELREKTDISFEFEEIKTGRRVDKVKFRISSAKRRTAQLSDSFEEHLDDFKRPNSFSEHVKRLTLMLGVKVTAQIIDSWEKHGQANVIKLLEDIQHRKDIKNPIGYITKVLHNSYAGEIDESSDSETVLLHLIALFRKSKDPVPHWYVEEQAVQEIQSLLNTDEQTATQQFAEIKQDLYHMLKIVEPKVNKATDQDIAKRKKRIEERLSKL